MGLSDLVQKAVYLGIGVAAYAGEKAGNKLTELPAQLQKLADEFVDRGEMTTEEAKRFVDDMLQKAQQPPASPPANPTPPEPRRIPIDDDTPAAATSDPTQGVTPPSPDRSTPDPTGTGSPIDPLTDMRQQVADLQAELRRLRNG
jgi:polyhydroxyalkanoate synthesis regulator phasin